MDVTGVDLFDALRSPPWAERPAPAVDDDGPASRLFIAPVVIGSVLCHARAAGLNPELLCRGLGFTPADLETAGAMVSLAQAAVAIRRALAALDQPDLGLELGRRANLARRGLLALALLAADSLGDAVALWPRYPACAGLMLRMAVEADDAQHALVATSRPGYHDLEPFLVDKLFAAAVTVFRRHVHEAYRPTLVEMVRRPPADPRAYERHFGCPVRYGCARNRLLSSPAMMAVQPSTADVMAFRLACRLLDAQRPASPWPDVAQAASRLIDKSLRDPPQPAAIAAALNLSERTFRRRLGEAGLNYRMLVDDVRKARASALVASGQLPLSEVAQETGFTDLSNFRKAFVRWTGSTPSALRQQRR